VAHLARILAATLACAACSGDLTAGTGEPGGGGEAREVWTSDVQPLFVVPRPKGACASCHQGVGSFGPAFLGPTQAESYDTLTAGGLIGATPESSRLLTIGEHTGNGFCSGVDTPATGCATDEVTVVSDWILILRAP
jgi:hypothetical protein